MHGRGLRNLAHSGLARGLAGFSLIELMIVVAIVGALSVGGRMLMSKYQQYTHDRIAQAQLREIYAKVVAADLTSGDHLYSANCFTKKQCAISHADLGFGLVGSSIEIQLIQSGWSNGPFSVSRSGRILRARSTKGSGDVFEVDLETGRLEKSQFGNMYVGPTGPGL